MLSVLISFMNFPSGLSFIRASSLAMNPGVTKFTESRWAMEMLTSRHFSSADSFSV